MTSIRCDFARFQIVTDPQKKLRHQQIHYFINDKPYPSHLALFFGDVVFIAVWRLVVYTCTKNYLSTTRATFVEIYDEDISYVQHKSQTC